MAPEGELVLLVVFLECGVGEFEGDGEGEGEVDNAIQTHHE